MSLGRIYIIEDDEALRDGVAQLLELQGFAVAALADTADFPRAASLAIESGAHCVLVDLTLPDASGHAICRDIRSQSTIPIIVLTSSDNEFDEVIAMNLGADDYVTKPYSPAVLIARIRSVLRRHSLGTTSDITYKGVLLNTSTCKVSFEGNSVDLTRNELQIFRMLMENPEVVMTRSEIMCALWESDAFVDDNTLTVNINRLRKKLASIGVSPDFLVTHRGIGYSVQDAG